MAASKNKTPTQLSVSWLKNKGFHVEQVETQQRHSFHKNDLLGFADLLALRNDQILLVQVTSYSHHADRKKKIINEPRAKIWLEAGGRINLQSWRPDQTMRFEIFKIIDGDIKAIELPSEQDTFDVLA